MKQAVAVRRRHRTRAATGRSWCCHGTPGDDTGERAPAAAALSEQMRRSHSRRSHAHAPLSAEQPRVSPPCAPPRRRCWRWPSSPRTSARDHPHVSHSPTQTPPSTIPTFPMVPPSPPTKAHDAQSPRKMRNRIA
eukprot:2826637-Prymnesium_polylepis.2